MSGSVDPYMLTWIFPAIHQYLSIIVYPSALCDLNTSKTGTDRSKPAQFISILHRLQSPFLLRFLQLSFLGVSNAKLWRLDPCFVSWASYQTTSHRSNNASKNSEDLKQFTSHNQLVPIESHSSLTQDRRFLAADLWRAAKSFTRASNVWICA